VTHRSPAPAPAQFRDLFRSLVLDPELIFRRVLTTEHIAAAVAREAGRACDRVFTPLVTLATFLAQVLSDDHSCRAAVARLKAYLTARGLPACALATGGYCKARRRLPEGLLPGLVRDTADRLQDAAPGGWLWRGRRVVIVDGSSVSMPDTAANQAEYPQHFRQKPGCGFPIARVVVLLSLATGAAIDLAIGRWSGKLTGENALLRGLRGRLRPGDVLLADSYYCSYQEVAALLAAGVDVVMRQHGGRATDFRRGRKLGREDHLVRWRRGRVRRPWMGLAEFRRLPRELVLREVRVRVDKPGFRTRSFVVVTSLLDPAEFPAAELATAYRWRWNAELDIRSIKRTLRMDVLRCHTPAMVRKEVYAHLLVYNLVRGAMAEAASRHGEIPRHLSFQGARQVLEGSRPELARAEGGRAEALRGAALAAIAGERVGHRPDRYEPRARKRREKMYPRLQEPRRIARKRLARAS
jgi:Transposase DDE domain